MNEPTTPDRARQRVRRPINREIRIGIAGAGAVSEIHRRAIASIPDAVVAGVWSRRRDPGPGWRKVRKFDHFEEMLESPDIDVIAICTPSGSHAAQGLRALEMGKHVVIEKPFALDPDDAQAVIDSAQRAGLLSVCISQMRYGSQMSSVAKLIRQGVLGRPIVAQALIHWYRDDAYYANAEWRGTWRGSGGVLANQGHHMIDLMCWVLGEADVVQGLDATLGHQIEAADSAVVAIQFKSGALGLVSATTAAFPGRAEALNLFLDRGYVTFEGGRIVDWIFREIPRPPESRLSASGASDPMAIGDAGHAAQWTDIVAGLRAGTDPRFTGIDALPVVRLLWAARSIRATSAASPT